ncbi:hypothetical protein [Caballeronia hypogeia]|uniref:hypothetical protein n=1 Tax=Caballeronia hypogeia TaxID=1777140 RepID=UPI0007721950|nr:hypothetical protein [Caballeronia hypogeia]
MATSIESNQTGKTAFKDSLFEIIDRLGFSDQDEGCKGSSSEHQCVRASALNKLSDDAIEELKAATRGQGVITTGL